MGALRKVVLVGRPEPAGDHEAAKENKEVLSRYRRLFGGNSGIRLDFHRTGFAEWVDTVDLADLAAV